MILHVKPLSLPSKKINIVKIKKLISDEGIIRY